MADRGVFDASSTPERPGRGDRNAGFGSGAGRGEPPREPGRSGDPEPEPGAVPEIEPTEFERAWHETVVAVSTPAEKVFVTMTGDHDIAVRFMPGWYYRATDSEIVTELTRAAKLAFAQRNREFFALQSRQTGEVVRPSTTIFDAQDADYRRRLEELHTHGESSDGSVGVSLVGMTTITVTVAPGATRRLGEEAFVAACRQAAVACFENSMYGWQRAKFEVYFQPMLDAAGVPHS